MPPAKRGKKPSKGSGKSMAKPWSEIRHRKNSFHNIGKPFAVPKDKSPLRKGTISRGPKQT